MTLTTVIKILCSWIMISTNVHSIRFVRFHSHIYLHRLRLFCLVRLEASVVDVVAITCSEIEAWWSTFGTIRMTIHSRIGHTSLTQIELSELLPGCIFILLLCLCVCVCVDGFLLFVEHACPLPQIFPLFLYFCIRCATLAFSLSVIMCRIGKIKTKMIYLQAK